MVRDFLSTPVNFASTSSPTLRTVRASSTRSRPSSEARSCPSTPLPRSMTALRVDRQHHGLDLLALLVVADRLLAGLIPGDVRQVHEAVDVAGEPDEDAE